MKTPAIIASLTVVGSIAYAAGQGGTGTQPPVMPPMGSQMHSMQEGMPQARSQMTDDGCVTQGADKNWFTVVHRIPSCSVADAIPQGEFPGIIDINGDGKKECVRCLTASGDYVRIDEADSDRVVMLLREVTIRGDSYANTASCILRGGAIWSFVRSEFPAATSILATLQFRDMDMDGDLDIVGWTSGFDEAAGKNFGEVWLWIENTGFQHTNYVAADLNHDGRVDGADLGLLLVAWGPNP